MKKRILSLIGLVAVLVATVFSTTGSYIFINNPRIPREMRKKDAE